jgi:hypothetical protein
MKKTAQIGLFFSLHTLKVVTYSCGGLGLLEGYGFHFITLSCMSLLQRLYIPLYIRRQHMSYR